METKCMVVDDEPYALQLMKKFYFRNKQHDSLIIRSEHKLLKISLSDIEYIEGVEDYCKYTYPVAVRS